MFRVDKEVAYPPQFMEEDHQGDASRKDYFDHIQKVNDIFYDQIKMSDQKAAYIFTFLLAFLISSTEGRGVFTLQQYSNQPLHIAFFLQFWPFLRSFR